MHRDPPLRVLVLEDEWPARNYLVQLIEQLGLGHVAAAVPSPALASEVLASTPHPIDLALVDIHLAGEASPHDAGLSWIASLRSAPQAAPRLVLTTASSEHALKAFELGVSDYLLKPFTSARVEVMLQRVHALGRLTAPKPMPDPDVRIAARRGRAIVFLPQREAMAFEAEGRLCFVHVEGGRLDVDLSLTSLEAVLGPHYLRVHRNWLVAATAVRSIERDGNETVLLVGTSGLPLRVPVARDRTSAVREQLLGGAVGLRRES